MARRGTEGSSSLQGQLCLSLEDKGTPAYLFLGR